MEKLSRRKLFTQVSLGAGAAGVLAVAAACESSSPPTQASGTPAVPTTDNPVAVFVTDPNNGTLVVVKDDKAVTVTNVSLTQNLLQLA